MNHFPLFALLLRVKSPFRMPGTLYPFFSPATSSHSIKAGWSTNMIPQGLPHELRFVAPQLYDTEILTLRVDSTLAVPTDFRSLWYEADTTFDRGEQSTDDYCSVSWISVSIPLPPSPPSPPRLYGRETHSNSETSHSTSLRFPKCGTYLSMILDRTIQH